MVKRIINLILGITLFFLLGSCNQSSNNTVISTIESPDGEHIAYIYVRDFGATTDYSFHVSILSNDEELKNKKGNTFITDAPYYNPNDSSNIPFSFVWNDNSTVTISYRNQLEVYKKVDILNEITIKYNTYDVTGKSPKKG